MENKKILVVDDDIDVVAVIETLLENEGYEVISAHNKVDGVKKAKEEKPALAILDVMMTTHFEGFELAKELFDSPETKAIPRLMQTSIDVLETAAPTLLEWLANSEKVLNIKNLKYCLSRIKRPEKQVLITEQGKEIMFGFRWMVS
jgi:CheY-like chemotaxis protein